MGWFNAANWSKNQFFTCLSLLLFRVLTLLIILRLKLILTVMEHMLLVLGLQYSVQPC